MTDPLTKQIIWNRLLSLVEEQAQILIRTAFSTAVREAGDLSAGIFDPSGRMIAQAVTGTPGHVNAMAKSVGSFLEVFPAQTLSEGDVLVTNDPWKGTGHLNDFTVVTPCFWKNRLVALFAATSHIADVGGLGFGADGRDVFEEGIWIPISHLFRQGKIDVTLIRLIKSNVRDPETCEGDLYSLAACNDAGVQRLHDVLKTFALDDISAIADYILAQSAIGMRTAISEVPPGQYQNTMRIDGYDEPIDLVAKVDVQSDKVTVDFAGTSGMSRFGINVPLTYAQAYASFGVRALIGGEIPNNHGSLSCIDVMAPEGCLLNAAPPAAVSARHAVGQMLPDVVMGALAKALPGRAPAEGTSCLWNPVLKSAGSHPANQFVVNPFHSGGTGARAEKDGLSATAFPSGVKNTPVEITETVAPLIIWEKEYIQDSGGAGRFRGGLGQRMIISHAEGQPFRVSKMFDRIKHAPRGRDGGKAGRAGSVSLASGPSLRGMGQDDVSAGERLVLDLPGGGGLGDPKTRDRAAVRHDLLEGYVSEPAAATEYGWQGDEDDV